MVLDKIPISGYIIFRKLENYLEHWTLFLGKHKQEALAMSSNYSLSQKIKHQYW